MEVHWCFDVDELLSEHEASHPSRQHSSPSLLWEPQTNRIVVITPDLGSIPCNSKDVTKQSHFENHRQYIYDKC
jgi:hypothetical protein